MQTNQKALKLFELLLELWTTWEPMIFVSSTLVATFL